MKLSRLRILLIVLTGTALFAGTVCGQESKTRQADVLRGSIGPERAWWDLKFYHLSVTLFPEAQKLSGTNLIRYQVLAPGQRMQIDLQQPLKITHVVQGGKELTFSQTGNAWMLQLEEVQAPGTTGEILVHYEGIPKKAVNPPWDGGVQWTKDSTDKWFIATSCQGLGASVWWPCKDHMYDEPDSMKISVTVPAGLKGIANGKLVSVDNNPDNTSTFHWEIHNPINNYGVNVNVGDYASWTESYPGESGPLSLSYYVLPSHLAAAKKQFVQVPMLLRAFEHWFGPYPFYQDGFKIVEVPYLGMEHQSSVTYGNQFQNGYLGRDLSGTGHGLKFDFILIHESGHEWFANSITYRDIADMWVHESFTAYAESLYLEYYHGKTAAAEYVRGLRNIIRNDSKIIGDFGLNHKGSSDMYYKGANLLHTLRQIVDQDDQWRETLRGLNREFYHQTVDGDQIIRYLNRKLGKDLTPIFKQYLEETRVPELQYFFAGQTLFYRWQHVIPGFNMPVKVHMDGQSQETWIHPEDTYWRGLKTSATRLSVNPDFYIQESRLNPGHPARNGL